MVKKCENVKISKPCGRGNVLGVFQGKFMNILNRSRRDFFKISPNLTPFWGGCFISGDRPWVFFNTGDLPGGVSQYCRSSKGYVLNGVNIKNCLLVTSSYDSIFYPKSFFSRFLIGVRQSATSEKSAIRMTRDVLMPLRTC